MGRGERERNDITPNPGSSDLAFCSDNSSEGNKKVFFILFDPRRRFSISCQREAATAASEFSIYIY